MKLLERIKKHFAPKTRAEIIDQKIIDLMREILIHDFTNEEIALIIRTMRDDAVHELKRRKTIHDQESIKTTIAINTL